MKTIVITTLIAAFTLGAAPAFAGRDETQLRQLEQSAKRQREQRAAEARMAEAQPCMGRAPEKADAPDRRQQPGVPPAGK